MKEVFRGFERWLERVAGLGRSPVAATEPIELRREILARIEDRVRDGRLPGERIEVRVAAPADRLEATRDALRDLEGAVRERLRVRGAAEAASVEVRVRCVAGGGAGTDAEPWEIRFRPRVRHEPAAPPEPPCAWLIVVRGRAGSSEERFPRERIHLGRLESVSVSGKALRKNHVWFVEEEDTVSRAHAHIERAERGWFLFDDHSRWGTRLVRAGGEVDVPRGSHRGVPLLHGDVIELGKVCALEFRTRAPESRTHDAPIEEAAHETG